jgi:hypothetical protein
MTNMTKVYKKQDRDELCGYLDKTVLDENRHGACERPEEEGTCDYMEEGRCTCYSIVREIKPKNGYKAPTLPSQARRANIPKGSKVVSPKVMKELPLAEIVEA